MIGIKSIFMIVVMLLLFGGAIYDIATTAGRCALSVSAPNSGYDCDSLWLTVGKTIISPDRNVGKGVEGILAIRQIDDDILSEINVLREPQTMQFQQQIIIGLSGFLVLFLFFAWICIKISPSSGIDAGSLLVSVLLAFLIMAFVSAVADIETEEHGCYAVLGERTPFKGIRSLACNPDVFGEIIDETALLPGTTTIDEITGDT